MRNEKKIVYAASRVVVVIIVVLIIFNPLNEHLWDTNTNKFIVSLSSVKDNEIIEDLSNFTPFEWDTLYSFRPYTPKIEIYKTVGYVWDNIYETVSESMNQIVFVKSGKVVGYIYGYPEDNKIGFNFGEYKGLYIKLTSKQKLSFKVRTSTKGVRYLDYIR